MNAAAEVVGRPATLAAAATLSQAVTSVVGVPLNVLVAASLGVLAGLAWSEKDQTRKQLAWVGFGSVFVACAVVAVLNAVAHFYKVVPEPTVLAPAALLIAFFGPRWVPAVNERIGPWLDKLPFIGKKGG